MDSKTSLVTIDNNFLQFNEFIEFLANSNKYEKQQTDFNSNFSTKLLSSIILRPYKILNNLIHKNQILNH